MIETLPETIDPLAGCRIPREDLDTLTDAQLREKYPKAFEFEAEVMADWAETKKKENARKATLAQMLAGDVDTFERGGVWYVVKPVKLRQTLEFAKIVDKYNRQEEATVEAGMRTTFEMCLAVLRVQQEDGTETAPDADTVLDTFELEDMNAILAKAKGVTEGEEGENPPTTL